MVNAPSQDLLAVIGSSSGSSGSIQPVMLGKFRLIGLLGEGSMGKVIRAEDTRLRRYVALKCLKVRGDSTSPGAGLLLQEARLAATLDHPGIVQVFEVGEVEGHAYISMELIEGGTLASLIKGCGPLDLRRACQLCAEAAEALAFAAEHGVVHRDIKPHNLLLTRGGRCKIADFGLASYGQAGQEEGAGVGTPAYVAPEVIAGEPATAEADVYSLCAVLCFLLTGAPPFAGPSREAGLRMHAEAPDVRTWRPDLPASIAKLVAAGLSKSPEERPSPQALAEQLRAHTVPLDDSQVLSVSSAYVPLEQEEATAPASPWLLIGSLLLGTGLVLAVVLGTALVLYLLPRQGNRTGAGQPALAAEAAQEMSATPANRATVPREAAVVGRRQPEAPVIGAGNYSELLAAAQDQREIVVGGQVSSMYVDAGAKMAVLRFAENPGFEVIYREPLYGAMARRFEGREGSGIVHCRVQVRGIPTLSGGKVIIELHLADDIRAAG